MMERFKTKEGLMILVILVVAGAVYTGLSSLGVDVYKLVGIFAQ